MLDRSTDTGHLPASEGKIDRSSYQTRQAAFEVLSEEKKGPKAFLPFLGPALIASIAYMDPGNFATNVQAGAGFGYKLLWVVVFANLAAMLFQSLSAKVGIVTGRNLPELCRETFSKPVNYALWIVSEIAAIATDLAEFLGATIALNLLFGIPLLAGTLITGCLTYLLLLLQDRGFRPIERVIGLFIAIMAACFVVQLVMAKPDWGLIGYHSVTPFIGGKDSVMLIVGIIGATVMPHAIFLHSSLTQNRIVPQNSKQTRQILKWSNIEVVVALSLAGLVNMAMLIMAAAVFHDSGNSEVASIETAYKTLTPLLGAASGAIFLTALLASGLSSSAVGTMAGQVIMQGFVNFRIPVLVRRLVTMVPAAIVIALGFNPTETLVMSQVVLSLVLPVPLVILVLFSARKNVMGEFASSKALTVVAGITTLIVLMLNAFLLLQAFGIELL